MLNTQQIETLLAVHSYRKPIAASGADFFAQVRMKAPEFIKAEYPGGANVETLACAMCVSRNFMIELLADMLKAGFVTKKQVKRHGRKCMLYIPT